MIRSEWVTNYIGAPYKAGGRALTGVDCWGLVCLIYARERGIELPTLTGKDARFDTKFKRVHGPPAEFDLAFFDAWPARSHCGVVLAPPEWLIQAVPEAGVIATRIDFVKSRSPQFYRWREVV